MIKCKDLNEAMTRAEGIVKRNEGKSYESILMALNQLVVGTNANDMKLRIEEKAKYDEFADMIKNIVENHLPAIITGGSSLRDAYSVTIIKTNDVENATDDDIIHKEFKFNHPLSAFTAMYNMNATMRVCNEQD